MSSSQPPPGPKRYSDFWRALAAGLLLGSVLIAAALVSTSKDSDSPGKALAPRPTVLNTTTKPMRARGCTDTWVATSATTDWMSAGNWSARRPPGPDDRVCIPDGALVSLNDENVTVGSVAVEGTLSVGRGAVLAIDDRARPSSFSVLLLGDGTLKGRSPVTVSGTFSWGSEGILEGPAPMRLARKSSTSFDPGDGGRGFLRRRLLAYGDFDLASGALYVADTITNFGHMHGNFESPGGYPAGLLDQRTGQPLEVTGKGTIDPRGLVPGNPGRRPPPGGSNS